jgi:zinc protease
MLQINVVFSGGSSRDGNQFGLAQFTNAMLDQGTNKFNADQIATEFDSVGAQFGNTVTRDMAIVSLQSLTGEKYLNPALQMFSAVLTTANFPQTGFERTQHQILNAIDQMEQEPNIVAQHAFYAALYGEQPYAHPTLGTKQTVSQLTPAALKNFYDTYYVAKNAVVTIVGAISKQQAENIVNQILSGLPVGTPAPSLSLATDTASTKEQRITFPAEQSTIMLGQIGITLQDPNYFSLQVGNYILGGAPLTSELFKQVREKRGLVYGIGSGFSVGNARGLFTISLQTRNDQAQQALQVTKQTLEQFLQAGPTEAQLKQAKSKIINSYPLSFTSDGDISGQLVLLAFYHLPLDYFDTYRQKISAVTVAQVKNAFQQKVNPQKMVTIIVGK